MGYCNLQSLRTVGTLARPAITSRASGPPVAKLLRGRLLRWSKCVVLCEEHVFLQIWKCVELGWCCTTRCGCNLILRANRRSQSLFLTVTHHRSCDLLHCEATAMIGQHIVCSQQSSLHHPRLLFRFECRNRLLDHRERARHPSIVPPESPQSATMYRSRRSLSGEVERSACRR